MTVRRRLLPAVLCLLAGYSLTAAAYNTSSSCTGTGNTTFPLQNITFYAGRLPADGTVLYTSPAYPLSYKCTTELSSQTTFAPSLQRLGDFQGWLMHFSVPGWGWISFCRKRDSQK